MGCEGQSGLLRRLLERQKTQHQQLTENMRTERTAFQLQKKELEQGFRQQREGFQGQIDALKAELQASRLSSALASKVQPLQRLLAELGETAYSSGYASGGGAAAAKVVVPPEETLRDHMTPALMVCQVELDKSKLMCKKAVTKAYREFKAAEDALKPKSKLGESTDSDDENIVEKLYDEAVENMGGKLGDEFRKLTTPKNPVV